MAANNSDNDRRIDYVELDVADVARAKPCAAAAVRSAAAVPCC